LCGKSSEFLVVNLAVHIVNTRPHERSCFLITTSTPYSTASLLSRNKLLGFWPRLSIEENKGEHPFSFSVLNPLSNFFLPLLLRHLRIPILVSSPLTTLYCHKLKCPYYYLSDIIRSDGHVLRLLRWKGMLLDILTWTNTCSGCISVEREICECVQMIFMCRWTVPGRNLC